MDFLFRNEGTVVSPPFSLQGLFPEVNFTCSGTIQSWIFGALELSGPLLSELQIWRPDGGDGSYTKVESISTNSTGITLVEEGLVEEGQTGLYQYSLSSPLHFQAGDILGYFQPARINSQWLLHLEHEGRGHQRQYLYPRASAASQLNVTEFVDNVVQLIVNVVTGKYIIGQFGSPSLHCSYWLNVLQTLQIVCVVS